jgi:organic hydroperoxide reductase OsmC/OhrA
MGRKTHNYKLRVTWTGNQGTGTSSYRAYSRSHEISAEGKPSIAGSSDPAFHGDPARWSPEDLLVAALSACHKLWYLGLCAQEGITVVAYEDDAEGSMVESGDGSGQFTEVVLRPKVVLAAGSDIEKARALHHTAHEKCFIAKSVNFLVKCVPDVSVVPT